MSEDVTPASPGPAPVSPATGGSLKRWLVASAALNLLFVGAIAGSMLMAGRHHGSWRGGGATTDTFGLMAFSRNLPDDRKKAIRKGLLEMRREVKPLRDAFWDAKSEPAKALGLEPFDKSRLAAAFAGIDSAEARLKAAARERLFGIIESMTPGERRALAERWQQRKLKRYGRGGRSEKPDTAGKSAP